MSDKPDEKSPRRAGRPKGSKNKPKAGPPAPEPVEVIAEIQEPEAPIPAVDEDDEEEAPEAAPMAMRNGYEMTFRCSQCRMEYAAPVGWVYSKVYCAKCDVQMAKVSKKEVR